MRSQRAAGSRPTKLASRVAYNPGEMSPRVAVGLLVALIGLGACSASPPEEFGPRSPVPDVQITFTLAPFVQADYPPCCEVTVQSTGTRTLYGFSCNVVAFDRDGDALYRGSLEFGPQGLRASPGKSVWGFSSIPMPNPEQIASSQGECQAWDWGSNGPPV